MIMIEMQKSSTALLLLVNPCIPHWNNDTTCPTYVFIVWKHSNPLCSSMNQQLFKRNFCSHYENYGWFLLRMKASMCLPQNQHDFSWRAKMNGTQRRALVSPWRMHCMYSGVKRHLSSWSNVEQWINQACSSILSHCWVRWVWRHQVVSKSVEDSVKYFFSNFVATFWSGRSRIATDGPYSFSCPRILMYIPSTLDTSSTNSRVS